VGQQLFPKESNFAPPSCPRLEWLREWDALQQAGTFPSLNPKVQSSGAGRDRLRWEGGRRIRLPLQRLGSSVAAGRVALAAAVDPAAINALLPALLTRTCRTKSSLSARPAANQLEAADRGAVCTTGASRRCPRRS